jgi:hypothetical protein
MEEGSDKGARSEIFFFEENRWNVPHSAVRLPGFL